MSVGVIAIVAFFALSCISAHSVDATEEGDSRGPDAKAEIKTVVRSQRDAIEADFTQVRHFSELDFDMTVKGHMSLKPGKELIWRTDSPMKTVCTMTPKGLTLWDAETKKTNSVNAKDNLWLKTIFDIQDKLMGGDIKALESHFKVERKDSMTMLLAPNDAILAGMFKTIQITFAGSIDVVSRIVFTETNGDTISITFTNVRS